MEANLTGITIILLGLLVVALATNILMIGRPREPLTPLAGLVAMVIDGAFFWLIWELAQRAGVL